MTLSVGIGDAYTCNASLLFPSFVLLLYMVFVGVFRPFSNKQDETKEFLVAGAQLVYFVLAWRVNVGDDVPEPWSAVYMSLTHVSGTCLWHMSPAHVSGTCLWHMSLAHVSGTYLRTYLRIFAHFYANIYAHIYEDVCVHVYTHVHTHTYIHRFVADWPLRS